MTGVALRCPSCGTTQAHAGECDACYEAQVRYFCDNHTPGLWLDDPQCKTCGARYGEAPKKRAPPSPVASAPAAPGRAPSTLPGGRSRGRTKEATPAHATRGAADTRGEHSKRTPDPGGTPGPPDLAELLHRALGGHARDGYGDEAWRRARPSIPRLGLGGCLRKLLLLVFIVLGLIVMGSFLLIGGALQFFTGG